MVNMRHVDWLRAATGLRYEEVSSRPPSHENELGPDVRQKVAPKWAIDQGPRFSMRVFMLANIALFFASAALFTISATLYVATRRAALGRNSVWKLVSAPCE